MTVMLVDESFDCGLLAGASCAFGVFDGVHVGHRFLIDQARESASPQARSVVLTFDVDPDEVFHPDRMKKLMRNADRLAALEGSGVDLVAVLPFTRELARRAPDDFLAWTFPEGAPAHLHVGQGFRFGAKAAGSVRDLMAWGARAACEVHAHPLVTRQGAPVSSSRIRALLADGKLEEATELLGHPPVLRERVQPGRGEGAGFGFATANLEVKPPYRVLAEGVYAAWAHLGDARYKAAVSVGVSPTFEASASANVEVHLLDFAGDLLGCELAVEFRSYLRPMRKFATTDALIAQVLGDIEQVRALLDPESGSHVAAR